MSEETTPATTPKVQLIPLLDNLVLQPCKRVDKVRGFHVPEAHQKELNQGIVLDKGPLCSVGEDANTIQLGDIVFFTQHSESRLAFREQGFIIVPESQCLGIIRGAKINDEFVDEDAEPSRILKPGTLIPIIPGQIITAK